jgi:hypothetical protein
MGRAVPKPPTVQLRRWPLFRYPDPWWALPVWYLGIAVCLLCMRLSVWAGFAALIILGTAGTIASTRATRQMRRDWLREWERLGQQPHGPRYFIPGGLRPRKRDVLLFAAAAVALVLLLAFAG